MARVEKVNQEPKFTVTELISENCQNLRTAILGGNPELIQRERPHSDALRTN